MDRPAARCGLKEVSIANGLNELDALAWTEQQAGLLRRLAAGERVNDAVDWPNVPEEIEAFGRSELHGCIRLLRHAMAHLPKLRAWPESRAAGHWRSEALGFLDDARSYLSPSMRQRINVDAEYAKALRQVRASTDESGAPCALPTICPFTLDGLILAEPDVADLEARLAAPTPCDVQTG